MANPEPLTSAEEQFWHALMRIVLTLPRQLHEDLIRSVGLGSSEYTAIMNLSEAPNRQLRIVVLAQACGLSPSRTTRIVDSLQSQGLVTERARAADGRGSLGELTSAGLEELRSAWPAHVASVRTPVLDHIPPNALDKAARALDAVAAQLDDTRAGIVELST